MWSRADPTLFDPDGQEPETCSLTCGFAGCPRQDSNLRRTV
jgi:hypothetical protein